MCINERTKLFEELTGLVEKSNNIDPEAYIKYNVKRGLRNSDGSGVLVGLTKIGEVHGYLFDEGEKKADEGRLSYRGIGVMDIVHGFQKEGRFGFEEISYLLLFGELPSNERLQEFNNLLGGCRILPNGFTEDMILKAPSFDIMNKLARSVLACYSYDNNPDDVSLPNILRQSLELIARFPTMMAYGYQAKSHYYDGNSLFIHLPKPELSTAENILHMIRPDNQYTRSEAEILDLALVLHAEHGGGNNSSFSTRVVSSTGTDTYSAIAAAVGALKGPKHGGANKKVMDMIENIKANISDWEDRDEVENYIRKIINKEAYDRTGLVYGMGHAVYTISDPRAVLLKEKAIELAKEKDRTKELALYMAIEDLTPKVFAELKGTSKDISPNVDFYSGFVYTMLNIPQELYTPIFAVSRIVGWCAHRIEELVGVQRIIRPAYKSLVKGTKYIPLTER
ncbi:MAG: citrate/2-methylcitrate synthase [Clostridia bacterium]|nr:citrate/2-methylcitrate synthase [Clostridia bacterium]